MSNKVDTYLSEQAEKAATEELEAGRTRLFMYSEDYGPKSIAKRAFLAGAQAAKEIYLLQGKIDGLYEGLKTQGTHGPYTKFLDKQLQEAKAQLEKLLTEKEQG